MRRLLVLALAVLLAGCLNQAKEAGCADDVGCPVGDLNVAEPAPVADDSGSRCGDGLLEAPEECDAGFPCREGYCQKCVCIPVLGNETVSDCSGACLEAGYREGSVVADGNCTYNMGSDDPCAIRCAYRKVFPSGEAERVCCCRDLKYLMCPKVDGRCKCADASEVNGICQQNKPR
ncbi:MAG: hypothetical protein V1875_03275 [Candidatus Altiarchaeota archaeon]